ncbi:siderophore iron transporter [Naviculisporaceae sp. PSN 640]
MTLTADDSIQEKTVSVTTKVGTGDTLSSNDDGEQPEDSEAQVGATSTSSEDGQKQAGVEKIEALTAVWSKTSLVVAWVMIWFIFFFVLMQQGALAALTPFVTSSFQEHSLTPTVTVFSSIIGGVVKLTLAKILDVFGRPQGYLISVIVTTLGLVMMAACNSVQLYAAAQVFYTVGQNALLYSVGIFIADSTSLLNRGFMIAFSSSPNLITTWLSGPISQAYLQGPGWAWAFGTFSVVVPVVTLPLFGLFVYNLNKAKKQGLFPKRESQQGHWQRVVYYLREFDAVGVVLLSAGLALFLTPFNIYSTQEQGWSSPVVISLLTIGPILIFLFVVWEWRFAPVSFIPFHLLSDRTVLGACVLSAIVFISYFCWASFFTSFLMVVFDLDVTKASYVFNAYNVGSPVWALVVGWIIRKTGRYKRINLWLAIPLHVLGLGLMIRFRSPDDNIGLVVMCLILVGFGSGAIIICDQIAAMAVTSHQYIAVVLALESMFSEIGGAIGLTVAASIWQAVFPAKLAEYLPAEDQPNMPIIYADLTTQLLYPVGSPTRLAIQHAYADAQEMMLIAGIALWAIGFASTLAWRDLDLKKIAQVKGHVI